MALLCAEGFRVVVSRTTDSTVLRLGPKDVSGQLLTVQGVFDEVAARDVCANDARANVLVGIYYDAGASPENAGSITAYDADRSFSSANLALANLIQKDVLTSLNAQGWSIPNGGVLADTGLGSLSGDPALGGLAEKAAAYDHLLLIGPAMVGYFSTPTEMPGAVVEPLYITDPFEGSIADSVAGQKAIARGIAIAVEQFLTPPQPTKACVGGLVHPGRFENCTSGVTSERRSRVCPIPFEPLRPRPRRARSRWRTQPEKETDHGQPGDGKQPTAKPSRTCWLSTPGRGADRSVLHQGLFFVRCGTLAHSR
jgi:hypothetical protein